jgi:acetyl/propionyl-CoA carboxylase alpha subunit
VTELCYGVDLVAWMVCLAYGCLEEFLGMSLEAWTPNLQGHAIQVRIYAEDPVRNFQPSPGVITSLDVAIETGTRVDTGVYRGTYTHYTQIPIANNNVICQTT